MGSGGNSRTSGAVRTHRTHRTQVIIFADVSDFLRPLASSIRKQNLGSPSQPQVVSSNAVQIWRRPVLCLTFQTSNLEESIKPTDGNVDVGIEGIPSIVAEN